MGRYRQNYSLYGRKLKDGRYMWYYRTYAPDGRRLPGKSTGCTSKTKARLYCENLLKEGLLYTGSNITLGRYAEGWYDDDSPYMRERRAVSEDGRPLAKGTLMLYKRALVRWIIPALGAKRVRDISSEDIRAFRNMLAAEGLSPHTMGTIMSPLKVVVQAALAEKLIATNPFDGVRMMRPPANTHDAFSLEEASAIIAAADGVTAAMCFIAAVTGMRRSEIFGIKREDIKESYLDLDHQYIFGEDAPLKNKGSRKIPLCPEVRALLLSLPDAGGYLFPYSSSVGLKIMKTMEAVGIKDIKERRLSFHSWRHFFITYMTAKGVDARLIASVTGHSTGVSSVQSLYINFKPEDYAPIYVQQKILCEVLGGPPRL